jgi:hypothetical protein
VSDGNYDYSKQGCSGHANNADSPQRTESECRSIAVIVSDGTHEYVTIGVPQTPDGQSANALEVCLDFGSGTRNCALFDQQGVHPEEATAGTPADPASGIQVYFGMDDNIDNGEHDSSSQISNGPSDGGAVQLNVAPQTVAEWLAAVQDQGSWYFLTHPLPLGDAGLGFCADGICFSAQTQRRTIYQGGDDSKQRDAANYDGHQWDPDSCAGPSDGAKDCGGHSMRWWYKQEGTVYAEPGIQIYEDPDAQASPIGPTYPIPAIYVGTCGLVAGGGSFGGQPVTAPPSPFTNQSGQLVVTTGC